LGNISERDLKGLIGNAAGIERANQADKIAVVAAPFFGSEDIPQELDTLGRNNWIIIGAIASGVFLILLVTIILILSRRRKKKKLMDAMDLPMQPQINPDEYLKKMKQKQQEDAENKILNLSNEKGLELKNKVRDLAGDNPEISAQLLRTWLKGGE